MTLSISAVASGAALGALSTVAVRFIGSLVMTLCGDGMVHLVRSVT